MTQLLHITGRTDWEAARRAGSYRISTRGVSLDQQGGDGELVPHIYGPLPVSAVTEVIPVGRDAAGRLILPEAR